MIGSSIVKVLNPINEGFFVIQTTSGLYQLKLGGIKTIQSVNEKCFKVPKELEFLTNHKIEKIFTNQESLFFFLSNDGVLVHSQSFVGNEGELSFELNFYSLESFLDIFPDFFQVQYIERLSYSDLI